LILHSSEEGKSCKLGEALKRKIFYSVCGKMESKNSQFDYSSKIQHSAKN
jgi:hypothetical protein